MSHFGVNGPTDPSQPVQAPRAGLGTGTEERAGVTGSQQHLLGRFLATNPTTRSGSTGGTQTREQDEPCVISVPFHILISALLPVCLPDLQQQ